MPQPPQSVKPMTPNALTPRMDVVDEAEERNEVEVKVPMSANLDEEDIPNNTDPHKSIDFKSQLDALKQRTEFNLPFTLSQVEDAMFLDQYHVVTLEFHYYQNDCKYSVLDAQIENIDENGDLIDEQGNQVANKFAIEKYQKDPASIHPMSAFNREDIINYVDSGDNMIKNQRSMKNSPFMRVNPNDDLPPAQNTMVKKVSQSLKNDYENELKALRGNKGAKDNSQMIEGILALYKINANGGMQRHSEVNLNMGRKYFPSENGNMVLTRSKDKKIISIANFNKEDPNGEYFKILAWTNKLKKFETHDRFELLHNGINEYYSAVKDTFDELVEVSFVGNSKFVQIIYYEAQPRSLEEQQAYEYQIEARKTQTDPNQSQSVKRQLEQDYTSYQKRQSPRRARKYVFFEVISGRIALEYGGVKIPARAVNSNNEEVDIFELGCLVKEIREDAFNPHICFFFAGDFMDAQIKDQQVMFKYAMNLVTIEMKQIFDLQTHEERIEFIQQQIRESISQKTIDGYLNYYPFNHEWIESQKFNWEQNLIPSSNRKFDQISIINSPKDPDNISSKTYYVHGQKFKEMLKVQNLKTCNYILDVPYFAKQRNDCEIRHSRNSNIKDQLFFDIIDEGALKTFCLRLDHADNKSKVCSPKININNAISQPDIWLHFKKNEKTTSFDDVFQTIHVSSGNQDGILQTQLPKQLTNFNKRDQHCNIVTRRTSTFYKQMADTPCIAYNLGDQKIVLQNTLHIEKKKKYILNLKPNEKFVCFLQFNQFEDIGFYPKGIRIECCSHFAFLTTGRGQFAANISYNRINLIVMDPFYEDLQVSLFRSNTFYDNSIFIENDSIIKSVVQSTMGKKRDKHFNTYLWTQYSQNLVRSRMLKNGKNENQAIDSDIPSESQDSDDDTDLNSKIMYEQVNLSLNHRDFIYYVTRQNGKCNIMEGNPRDPYIQNHQSIYSLKAEKCLAFAVENKDTFFFMDEQHIVYMLTRNENNRQLCLAKELTMKEIQRLDLKPNDFDDIIMTEKFVIQGSKIFYLYDVSLEPFPEGIFEAENLVEQDRSKPISHYISGSHCFAGSSKFFNVYQTCKFQSHINIQQKPDCVQQVLINDFLNWVDMSTFLDDGKILVKIRRRFMVFTSNGNFIDEVSFNDNILNENVPLDEKNDRPSKTLKSFRESQRAKKNFEVKMTGAELLQARRIKDPILDFLGNPYQFQSPDDPVPLSNNNKMEMMNMSQNNRWFLFYNRMMEQLFMYELVMQEDQIHVEDSFTDYDNYNTFKIKPTYIFKMRYVLDFDRTHMFQHMYTLGVDPIEYYRDNLSQVKINNSGQVSLCYIENLPVIDIMGASQNSQENQTQEQVQCRVIGAIFTHQEGKFIMKSQSFMHVFDFPRDAQKNLSNIIDTKKNNIDRQINSIRASQARLPKQLFDYSQFENLIEDLTKLENKKADYVYAKVYFDNLLLVYCGNYVKFGKLIANPQKKKKSSGELDLVLEKMNGEIMTDMHVHFDKSVEIFKVIETVEKNRLQVIAQDHENDIYSILSWDFDNNMELSSNQMLPDEHDQVGLHVVKGMNQKMNYFLSQHYLIDLEYNIPLRQTNVNQNLNVLQVSYTKQLNSINNFFNQRKVYIDNQKILGVEKANCIFYPVSRMDLILWKDINVLGEKAELIQETCSLQQCNLVIDGTSLFHYFADNSDLIEQIHQRFNNEKLNGTLSKIDKTLPLQILNPDNDGRTALFLAVQSQSPQSFECMIELLQNFQDTCVTKMMLQSMSMVLQHSSELITNFFDECIFRPPQMQIEQFIPWEDDDMEQFIFPSHTSVISTHLLVEKMQESGMDVELPQPKRDKSSTLENISESQIVKPKSKHAKRAQLRDQTLIQEFETGLEEGEKVLRRVQIEALDFDWIFQGDNAQILLSLLATSANSKVLTKKSIKTFVDLMWGHYQKAIIRYIFIPYFCYLASLSFLAGYFSGSLIMIQYEDLNDPEILQDKFYLQARAYPLVSISTSLMICFGSLEVKSMWQDGFGYFADPWNCVDAISLSTNTAFLTMCTLNFSFENEYFMVEQVRAFGGFACFFMWIKVFYWMRLFSSLAYYVKLIQQTISDSMPFMLMVAIIILAYANFFYVINRNLQESESDTRYYEPYTGHAVIDVLISVYMMGALGDFDNNIYRVGYDTYWAMGMFILATFIICVVFMNMLIAIMGETFGQVTEESEESGLKEQVVLIADHAWLIDLKKVFKNQKYIILVKPSQSTQQTNDVVVDQVKEAEETILKKMNRFQNFVSRRIDSVDTNTRFLLKYQEISIQNISKKVKNLEKLFKQTFLKETTENVEENLTEVEKLELAQIRRKKKDILNALNLQTTGQTLNIDNIQEHALNWMELADRDGSGELDFNEFYAFFSEIESIMITEEEIKQIFEDFDGSGNGQLSVEEFARAIYQAVLADNDEYSDDQEQSQN